MTAHPAVREEIRLPKTNYLVGWSVSDEVAGSVLWRAECARCGWAGPWKESGYECAASVRQHRMMKPCITSPAGRFFYRTTPDDRKALRLAFGPEWELRFRTHHPDMRIAELQRARAAAGYKPRNWSEADLATIRSVPVFGRKAEWGQR